MSTESTKKTRTVVDNRRARHDYELSEFTVCGIVLFGSEARSIRDGNVSIAEAYCLVSRGEMFVRGMRVEPLKHAAMGQEHNPDRDKKLLLNRREIDRLEAKTHGTGLTIVPVELVLVGRNFKLKVALGRGKKKWDKRQSEKEKSARREMRGE